MKRNMKLVKEKLTEEPKISEGLKMAGHQFHLTKTQEGVIYAGDDGILGLNSKLIPWDIVKSLLKKYGKK